MYEWKPKCPLWRISFSFYSRLNLYTYSFIHLDIYNNKKRQEQQQNKEHGWQFCTALNMREYGFSLTRILPYSRIIYTVLKTFVGSTENENRRSYLLTYAQAGIQKFPNCLTFSECILDAFTNGKSSRTLKKWPCCMEDHDDGGKHYHMVLNLSGKRIWRPIKNCIYNRHKI